MVHRYVTGNGIATHVGTVGGGLVASVGDHDARCGGLHKQYASACYEGYDRMAVMEANAKLIADAPRLAGMAQAGKRLTEAGWELLHKDGLNSVEALEAEEEFEQAIAAYEEASK